MCVYWHTYISLGRTIRPNILWTNTPLQAINFFENDTQKTRDTRTFTSPHVSCTWSQVTTPSNNGTLNCHISIPVLYVSEIIFEKDTIAETVLRVRNTVIILQPIHVHFYGSKLMFITMWWNSLSNDGQHYFPYLTLGAEWK